MLTEDISKTKQGFVQHAIPAIATPHLYTTLNHVAPSPVFLICCQVALYIFQDSL